MSEHDQEYVKHVGRSSSSAIAYYGCGSAMAITSMPIADVNSGYSMVPHAHIGLPPYASARRMEIDRYERTYNKPVLDYDEWINEHGESTDSLIDTILKTIKSWISGT